MGELLKAANRALRDIWHWRWIGLCVAWVVGIVGTVVTLQLPDRYQASARVYVDTESVIKPLLAGITVQPNVSQRVNILSRTLINRPNIEKLIRITDMDHAIKTEKDREELIDSLAKKMSIEGAATANLYTFHYTDEIPARALKTTQSLLSIFMESGLGEKRKDSQTAREFIDRQLKEYEQKLVESENRLKEFRLKNMSLLSGEKDHFGKLDAVAQALRGARLGLREAEESRDALRRELNNPESGEEPILVEEVIETTSPKLTELENRLSGLRKDLDELMRRFTEKHPDIITANKLIAQLEEQKKAELDKLNSAHKSKKPSLSSTSTVKQQLQLSIAEADATAAGLRARVREYESQLAQLQANSKVVPEIEAESAQLNRDYEVMRKQYSDLVARRESATLTGELESAGSLANFRIIDPPRVETKPSAPNRLLLLPIALAIAIVAGVAVSFMMSQIMPTIQDAAHLREISKRPVLGSISLLVTDRIRSMRRRSTLYFFGGVGGLISSMAMVLVFILVTRP